MKDPQLRQPILNIVLTTPGEVQNYFASVHQTENSFYTKSLTQQLAGVAVTDELGQAMETVETFYWTNTVCVF